MQAPCFSAQSGNTFQALFQWHVTIGIRVHRFTRPSGASTGTAPGMSATPSWGGTLGAPWRPLRGGLERCRSVVRVPLGEFEHGRSADLGRSPRDELDLYGECGEFLQLHKLSDHLLVTTVDLERRLIW
jgi:hypothetical protein